MRSAVSESWSIHTCHFGEFYPVQAADVGIVKHPALDLSPQKRSTLSVSLGVAIERRRCHGVEAA
jgi:hypothetical protein